MSKAEQIADMMSRGTWTGRRSAQRLAVRWGWQPSRVVSLAAEVAAVAIRS
jgi:hypothetical protein